MAFNCVIWFYEETWSEGDGQKTAKYQRNLEKGIKLINILITLFNYFNGGRTPNRTTTTNSQKLKKTKKENWLNNGIYLITITKYFHCFIVLCGEAFERKAWYCL